MQKSGQPVKRLHYGSGLILTRASRISPNLSKMKDAVGGSWRKDEIYIKLAGKWKSCTGVRSATVILTEADLTPDYRT